MPVIKAIVIAILTWEARLVLWRYRPKVIAITGSMGKTTTKDAVYAALAGSLHVRKSEKSFNSELGVPLTILGLENAWKNPLQWGINIMRGLWLIIRKLKYPEWLVVEVGADRPGDIRRLAKWLRPDIAVITGVPEVPVHVEFFRSPDELAREKRALAEHLRPGGTLVLNGDDARMTALCAEFRHAMRTYGLARSHDFSASHLSTGYEKKVPTGVRFKMNHEGVAIAVSIQGALGMPRVYAALAAFAVAKAVGIDGASVAEALRLSEPPPGRMRIIRGANGSTVIDDTYNSSPAAAFAALDTLKEVKVPEGGRRIAILGDMLELGKYSADAHRQLGARAADAADLLLTIGFRSRAVAEGALDAGLPESLIRQYEHSESRRAGQELREELREGDVVLVKGSQAMRMERAVEELMADPEQAADLLVRQEPEWLLKN